ncbi:MAG: rhodanese-like domain-containing protein [Bacteroidetes bacterium]|nr:rhodanese-like domain-containing protein [Bacteroidota bacterium]MBS1972758.1 rhodanese-like domain-containing protein [Bacteroidota bacterium]
MIGLIKKIFSKAPKTDFAKLISEGAVVLDVRTKGEYAGGHVKNSVNIPLNELQGKLGKLKKDKAIITCCASGMRSASAKNILKSNGFTDVHNGGSWMSVNRHAK